MENTLGFGVWRSNQKLDDIREAPSIEITVPFELKFK